MPAKAGISPMYRIRLAIIAGICIWWTQAAIRDGLYYYPLQNEKVALFEKTHYVDETKTTERPGWQDEWSKIAQSRGWSEENPGNRRTGWDIWFNLVSAMITAPIGLYFLINFLASFKKWVATNETGVAASNGQVAPWHTIVSLDKSRWGTKGIARVNYHDDGGEKRIMLDDWKFEAAPTKTIVAEIEQHLKPEQIIGGPPALSTTEVEAIERSEGIPPTHQG